MKATSDNQIPTDRASDGITQDRDGRYVALRTTRAVFHTYEDAVAFMTGAALDAPVQAEPLEALAHGGNVGKAQIPYYIFDRECGPEYDQGHSVVVWYDDLYNLAERADKAEADHAALREALVELDLFQRAYKKNTGDTTPGNDFYAPWLMGIVTKARAALARTEASQTRQQEPEGGQP